MVELRSAHTRSASASPRWRLPTTLLPTSTVRMPDADEARSSPFHPNELAANLKRTQKHAHLELLHKRKCQESLIMALPIALGER